MARLERDHVYKKPGRALGPVLQFETNSYLVSSSIDRMKKYKTSMPNCARSH